MNPMEFMVAQATVDPIKSTDPPNKKMSAELELRHNKIIERLTKKYGYVTTKMVAEDQQLSIYSAYTMLRHAERRKYIRQDGKIILLRKYVRVK